MKIIQGDTKPKAEEKHLYQLTTIIPDYNTSIFSSKKKIKYTWTLYKFVNNQWQQVKNNVKYGEKNKYLFGEGVAGIPFKIRIHSDERNALQINENKLIAELTVVPKTAKEPKIGRVILLNKANSDVNKAKFNEQLTAQARTSNLLGKEITFYLWEEGVSEFEKYKKPKKGRVNKYGIAEVKFNLSEYASQQTWMNFFQPNSNSTKKFYVTATFEDKKETNKAPVTATNGQQVPKTPQQPSSTPSQPNQNQDSGILSRSREIIAEGIGSFFQSIENAVSASEVNQHSTTTQQQEGSCPRCKKITLQELQQLFPDIVDKSRLEKALSVFQKALVVFGIDTCLKKAHFFAQVLKEVTPAWTESGGESMDYSTERLVKGCYTKGNAKDWVKGDFTKNIGGYYTKGNNFKTSPFNKKRIPDSIAQKYGRKDLNKYGDGGVQKANQKMLAIWAYASKRDDKGTPLDEDGYWFRGKGLMQITWKENYDNAQKIIANKFSNKQTYSTKNIDIVKYVRKFVVDKNDENFAQSQEEADEYSIVSACGDWAHKDEKRKIGKVAQAGSSDDDVDKVTAIINLKTDADSYSQRRKYFHKTKVIFTTNLCTLKKEENAQINKPQKNESTKNSKYNIDKAVEYVNNNAEPKSLGKCAKYVRLAINAGGITNIFGHATEYYDTDKLVKYGFTKIGTNLDSISIKKGDIAAFGSVKGHPYGHVAMWNGTQWVSDFKQKSFWVAKQYSVEKKYAIYRWEE